MDDFEDEARLRSHLIGILEDSPQAASEDEYLEHDNNAFSSDDLDRTDEVLGAMPEGTSGIAEKVSLRDQKWQALKGVAPFVRITPPSVLQGTLGGQQLVSVGKNAQVVMWGGEDADTLPVTCTFAPVDPTAFETPGVAVVRPYGIVRWGTRGFSATAYVDIGRGCQFTVNASEVELQVGVESYAGTSVSVQLGGMISFYPTTHHAPLTRSLYCDSYDPVAGFLRLIPPFARGVMLRPIVVGGNTAQWDLDFFNSTGTQISGFTYPATVAGAPVLPLSFIPLSGQATSVQVSGAGATLPFELIFELAF